MRTTRVRSRSNERFRIVFLDWMRKLLQLSAVATIVVIAYLIYGFIAGGATDWASLDHAARVRIADNVAGAIRVLNVSLALLLLSSCILFVDEEALGYGLVAGACFLYFGVPYLISATVPDLLEQWTRSHNPIILELLAEVRLAGLMLAAPGLALALRDIVHRITDGSRRNREKLTAMEYGGAVQEEKPISPALIGAFAQCWRMPFCREFIRVRCPIYHARTRCWRERVGCMCEENVIRTAMAAMIEEAEEEETKQGPIDFASPVEDSRRIDLSTGRPVEKPRPAARPRRVAPKIRPRDVKIPHNPNIPMSKKKERCRNCVIYNEHERMKYQLLAPIAVFAVPALVFLNLDAIQQALGGALQSLDTLMQRMSLAPTTSALGLENLAGQERIAQYAIIACLTIVATTAVLRFIEHCIFRLKV